MAHKKNLGNPQFPFEGPARLHSNPHQAADELEATLYFLHRRYLEYDDESVPQLPNFIINRLDVQFSDVERIIIEKHWKKRTIDALAPRVSKEKEEEARTHLHILYSPLLIRCQLSALNDVYQMLFSTLDETGKEVIMNEYREYRKNHAAKRDKSSTTQDDGER